METETLEKAMIKSQKSFADAKSGSKSMSEAYQKLGIDIGSIDNSSDAFDASIKALADIQDETTRNALANDLFGKSYAELAPLLNQGSEGINQLKQEAVNLGTVMSNQGVAAAAEFGDNLDRLKMAAGGAGNTLSATFLPAISGMVSQLTQLLPGITSSIAGIFSGENMGAQLTQTLTDTGLQAVSGLAANLPQFLEGFNTIITSVVTSISQVLPEAINTILPILTDGFFGLVSSLIEVVPQLLPTIVEGAITLFTGLMDGLNEVIPQLMGKLPELITKIGTTLTENLPTIIQAGFDILISLIEGLTNAIPSLITQVAAMIPVIVNALTSPEGLTALITAGIDLIVALAQGLPQAIPTLITAIPEIVIAIVQAFASQDWMQIGKDILSGIANGLIEGVKAIGSVIAEVGKSILNGFKDFFGIHSPSTMFRDKIGKYLAQGIGVGFESEMQKINKDMSNAVSTDFSVNANAVSGINPLTANGSSVNSQNFEIKMGDIVINGNTDNNTIGEIKDIFNDYTRSLTTMFQKNAFKQI